MSLSDLLPGAPSFVSGPSPQQAAQLALSPASVERRRRVAEAMMKQGMDYSPVQSPWQGVARVTNAIMGGLDERKADDIERAGLASQRDADAAMYGGLGNSAGVPITGALGGATPPAGGTNGSPAPVAAVPLPSGDLAKHAYDYFTQKGYTPAAAAGLVGNMGAESGFAPDVLSGQRMGDKGTSGYLGQWHADRLTNYQNFAKAQGKSPADYQTQLDFYNHELDTSEGRTKELLQGVNDPVKAAAIAAGFERPYGWKLGGDPTRISGWDKRAGYAQHAFNQWGQAAPQVASADPDITGSVTPPAGPGASLSPQDMATLTARYGGQPNAGAGITDAPVAINPPAAGASGPLSPAAANPLNPGAITDAPLPPGVLPQGAVPGSNLFDPNMSVSPADIGNNGQVRRLPAPAPMDQSRPLSGSVVGAPLVPPLPPSSPAPALGANGLPEATNAGLRHQGIDPLKFMHGYEPLPAQNDPSYTGGSAPVAAPAPVPAPAPASPRAAVLAALQGSPDLKDSQVQMMIARGINPANPQAPVSPARQSILAALSGAAPVPPQAAQSPAAAQVTGALAAPATVPASVPPYPGQPTPQGAAPIADASGNPAQLAAAIKTMSNPWAPEGSRQVAKTIIDRELQSRDPLRQLQVEKLRLELGGGTADEKRARQLAIQKAEKELATPPEEWAMSDGVMYNKRTGEQKTDHAGMFMGKSVDAQALNYLVLNGQLSKEDAANIAAGKPITGPNGEMLFLTPKGIMSQKPGQPPQAITPPVDAPPQGAPASPIAAPAPQSNPGIIPITAPKPVKASEAELNAQTYADRMLQSGAILDNLGMKGTGLQDQLASQVPLVGNSLVSEDFQKADQAKRDFINAQLRRESGAAISAGEFESANKQYFPQRGDPEDVVAQKAKNRKTVIDGMVRSGGPTYKLPGAEPAAPPPVAAAPEQPAHPPMEGARRAPNGKWYVKNPAYGTDPTAPQWFEVQP